MKIDNEKLHDISMICRFIYKEGTGGGATLHRNTVKKKLLKGDKIPTKNRFESAFEGLVSLGIIQLDKDNVSINKDFIRVGVIQKNANDDYYVVSPEIKKHIAVNKRDASGYQPGDVVNMTVEYVGGKPTAILLGRAKNNTQNTEMQNNIALEKALEKRSEKRNESTTKKTSTNSFEVDVYDPTILLGRVVKLSHNDIVFIPNKKSLPVRHIPILNKAEEIPNFQDRICVMKLTDADAPGIGGEIIDVKGLAGNPIHEFDALFEMYGAIMNWDEPELQAEIEKIPSTVDSSNLSLISEEQAQISQKGKTVDLRNLPFTTTDPVDCADMDDAIYSTLDENGNFVCYTAVANVTKYVKPDSAIAHKYVKGAFTMYGPNMAKSVLPNQLSSGICSLNPNVDRLALVVKTVIDKNTGEPISYNIYDAIINSHKKYSYQQAQEITDELKDVVTLDYLREKIEDEDPLTLDEVVLMNYYSARAIQKGFDRRHMVQFDSNDEHRAVFDEDKSDIVDIVSVPHLDYNEVIANFMLTTNETTAKYINEHNINGVYRVHDAPSEKKVNQANEFFNIMGYDTLDELSVQNLNDIISMVHGTPNEEIVNKFLIKTQSRAKYSTKPYKDDDNKEDKLYSKEGEKRISHFALQSERYSHSTSIIRRSPDYPIHYNILANIHQTKPLSPEFLEMLVEQANKRQLDIDQFEKNTADVCSVIYAEKHIGESFNGQIEKFRYCSAEEGYSDNIVVVAKNHSKGISVELPLSKVVGNIAQNCHLSEYGTAIYDDRGNIILKLCTPIDFTIENADRKTMSISGKATQILAKQKEHPHNYYQGKNGYIKNSKRRAKPYSQNKNKYKKPEHGSKAKQRTRTKDVYERYGFEQIKEYEESPELE